MVHNNLIPMSDKARLLILECKGMLDNYRMYGSAVDYGLTQLDKLSDLVSVGKMAEAYNLAQELSGIIAPYRPFIADIAEKLDAIKAILEEFKS
jgi:hypothetical protein